MLACWVSQRCAWPKSAYLLTQVSAGGVLLCGLKPRDCDCAVAVFSALRVVSRRRFGQPVLAEGGGQTSKTRGARVQLGTISWSALGEVGTRGVEVCPHAFSECEMRGRVASSRKQERVCTTRKTETDTDTARTTDTLIRDSTISLMEVHLSILRTWPRKSDL